jgi:hypothetical protein
MAFLTGPFVAAVGAPGEVHSSQKNPLGALAQGSDGNIYIYLPGVASVVAYDWVAYDEAYTTSRLATSSRGPVAIATAAVVANTYGWFGVKGSFTAAAKDVADNANVYSCASGGAIDDALVKAQRVLGAVIRSTDDSTAKTCTVQIDFPFCPGKLEPTT